MARLARGEVNSAATTVIATVIVATNSDGMPNRTTCESASTSLVVRATRSPVPARSTVDSGRLTARATNCSRSRANTVSPRMNDNRRAAQVRQVWATTATARPTAISSTACRLPRPLTSSTSRPTSQGAASAARAARACSPRTRPSSPR